MVTLILLVCHGCHGDAQELGLGGVATRRDYNGSGRTLEDTSRDSATEERDGLVEHVASLDVRNDDGIGITLNGARFTPRDAAGKQVPVFLYNGTTYVPVRAISEAMGMDVSFNSATRTVQLTTADRTASQQGASSASGNYISADRAKQIALNDAGVKEANAVFLRANLDWDDGRMKYEVEFYSGTTEYDYDIDAVTGAILSSDRELENFQIWNNGTSRPSGNGSNSSSGDYITAERAQQIALAETPSGSTVVKCQFDWDDGRAQYEVEIRNGWTEYEFEIDAVTGTIFSRDIDNDRW